jgi:hypothetical protein
MFEVPAELCRNRRERVPERVGMHPESCALGEPIHHRLDARSLVRRPMVIDEQLRQRRLRA